MKKLTLILFVLFTLVAYSITTNLSYTTGSGAKASTSYSATDTVFTQTFQLQGLREVTMLTNLTGTANAGNYLYNDYQGRINGTWVTIASDSAGVGYSAYTLRIPGTFTIPANEIRIRTRRYRASGTLVANQQISGS